MQEQTHITQLLEQNKLLMEMVRAMQIKIDNIEAKTDNIHRIFNKVEDESKQKKLSPKQQRAKDLKDEIEAERLEIVKKLNRK